MSTINCIKCWREEKTKAYAFNPFIFNKSLFARNELVYKDLNGVQMGMKKDNNQ